MSEIKLTLGQTAYETYRSYLDTHNLPPWNALPLVICAAWELAAKEVAKAALKEASKLGIPE